jgi:hypothetical protein
LSNKNSTLVLSDRAPGWTVIRSYHGESGQKIKTI